MSAKIRNVELHTSTVLAKIIKNRWVYYPSLNISERRLEEQAKFRGWWITKLEMA